MTRANFKKTMEDFDFKKNFESKGEIVWKRGRNQLELFDDDTILLARSSSFVVKFPIKIIDSVYMEESADPEILVFALTNGTTVEVNY